jgi:hypothetical protein
MDTTTDGNRTQAFCQYDKYTNGPALIRSYSSAGWGIKRKCARTQGRNLHLVRQTPSHQSVTVSVGEYFVYALRLCALASLR